MRYHFCRFLATGNTFNVIARSFRMGDSTCASCIYSTLDAIWTHLGPKYLGPPTAENWIASEKVFRAKWNFPHCVAAADGKHIQLQSPRNTGSVYHNYKGTFSTVLLALVDANYCFRYVSVGSAGREGDAGIFADSDLGRRLEDGSLGLPPSSRLPGSTSGIAMPHVIVGDEAFPLKTYLLRPYPGSKIGDPKCHTFNKRLSRARMVVECAFGILAQRFRCFRGPLQVEPENAKRIVRAACVLHNLLREKVMNNDGKSLPQEQADETGEAYEGIAGAFGELPGRIASNMHSRLAREVRDRFADYFSGEGTLGWMGGQ